MTALDLAQRARVSRATVTNVEAGRVASLDTYARLAVALGISLELEGRRRHSRTGEQRDIVHAAMGEIEAGWLSALGYQVGIDQPYQHYQFAGRADVVAWTEDPPALLHIENRTRFPDIQSAAGSYNAKRQYLADDVAQRNGIDRFASETHVMVGLWSSEVIHTIRLRSASFRALCPDPGDRLDAWLAGGPPSSGRSSSLVLLDPFAKRRPTALAGFDRVLAGAKPRVRGYVEAAERLRASGRA